MANLATALLSRVGLCCDFELIPLPGGRNNRVFRLETGSQSFLLKQYFQNPADDRDRLGHEYALLEYLHSNGSTYAARPYAADRDNQVLLMEFIPGARIGLEHITARHIDHALHFFEDLNRYRFGELGQRLPTASEACFNLPDHLTATQRRIDRLAGIRSDSEIDSEAHTFVVTDLVSLWREVRARVEMVLETGKHPPDSLTETELCISPSDFGLHNALELADGQIRFVDFEYAGWDDPAKLISDFANQPDMTLERVLSNRFSEAVIGRHPFPEKLRIRVQTLEPLYQIKWACICLNDFLPAGAMRRNFTAADAHPDLVRKESQLRRARTMLGRARETFFAGNLN